MFENIPKKLNIAINSAFLFLPSEKKKWKKTCRDWKPDCFDAV